MRNRPEPRAPRRPIPDDPVGDVALWQALGVDPDLATGRLAGATVTIEVFGDVPTSRLASTLGDLGLRTGEVSDFTLALAEDYLHEGLWERNLAALETGQPWLLAKPVGTRLSIGPAFWPGRTACWECLAEAIRAGSPPADGGDGASAHGEPSSPRSSPGLARLPCTVQAGLALTVTEVARAMATGEPRSGEVTMLTFDLVHRVAESTVVRPQRSCPACSVQAWRAALRSVTTDGERPADPGREDRIRPHQEDEQATA
jgi:oxazoline/thiazoline synthase